MFDINQREITEGQFIQIVGCKVKNDNGIYIVNKKYEKGDYCLYKVKQDGSEAKTKYNIYFLDNRHDPEKVVKIIEKDELKQAAKEVKAYVDGLTNAEAVHTFFESETQEPGEGKYLKFLKSCLLTGHTNTISGIYEIEKMDGKGRVSLWLIGKRGERIAWNTNGYYQFQPIMLNFSAETVKKLFEENYIEIMERSTTTRAEQKQIIAEEPDQSQKTEPQNEPEPPPQEDIKRQETNAEDDPAPGVEPVYYPISEDAARQSRGMWSFSDYVNGSETEAYRRQVDRVYSLAAKVADKRPEEAQRVYRLAEKFSRKYADHINTGFQIEMMCPSVMISGGSNFPVRKKEKQNARRDRHMEEYNYIMGIPAKIESILYGREIIKSNDENAIERLQEKIYTLTEELEQSKNMNKYYRKYGTIKGFEGLPNEQAEKLDAALKNAVPWANTPAPSFELTSIRNKIKAAEGRIKEIKRLKKTAEQKQEQPGTAYDTSVCEVKENTDIMRIQLLFDGKPSSEIRDILKSHGFRWAPSEGAWQRQLTDNARYSTKQALKKIEVMEGKTA